MLTGWWDRLVPCSNKIEGEFQNGTSQHFVFMVLQAPHGFCLCPQGKLELHPASLGGSPRPADGSNPDSFQITTSALGPRVVRFCICPLKVESQSSQVQQVKDLALSPQWLAWVAPGAQI